VPDFQTWLSSNVTFVQNWEEETNTSSSVLIVFGILVIGSFVYLIYDALKESNTEKLEKKVDKLIKEIRRDRKEQKNKL
jgi:chromatin remodeling complex protein RSC6